MIDFAKFSIRSLWRQLLADFELNDLDDAVEIIAAIRVHPNYTPAHEPWFQDLLSNLLCDALLNGSYDWAMYLLREGTQVWPEAAGHAMCRGFSDDEKLDLLDAFYKNGWDVNSADDDDTPIFSLATDSEPLVRWFLSHGADTNLSDPYGQCPIDRAAACGSSFSIYLLLSYGAKLETNIALHHAARRRSPDDIALPILSLLLEHQENADLNGIAFEQHPEVQKKWEEQSGLIPGTALHAAVGSGSPERVRILLQKGADARIEDNAGQTPLELARRYGYVDAERLLLEWLGRYTEEIKEPWELVEDFEVLEISPAAEQAHNGIGL